MSFLSGLGSCSDDMDYSDLSKRNPLDYSQVEVQHKSNANMSLKASNSTIKSSSNPGSQSNSGTMNGAYVDMGKVLLEAAKAGDADRVQECIKNGAPFITDWLGTSALHIAAKNNFYETCATLLRSGISKDAKTKVDRTPLHFAVFEGNFEVCQLLIQNDCCIDPIDMLKMTPLHWAIEKNFDTIAELLLENGANGHLLSKFLKTPYTMAKEKNNDLIVHLIEMMPTPEFEKQTADATSLLVSEMNIFTKTVKKEDVREVQRPLKRDRIHSYDAPDSKKSKPSTDDASSKNMALQLLKDQMNIQMLNDAEDNLIQSALQSGRRIMLSEAGKRILNDSNLNKFLKIPINTTISSSSSKKSSVSRSATITSRRASESSDVLEIFRDGPSGSGTKKVKPDILNIIRSSAELQEVTITQRSKITSPASSPIQKSSISLSAINVPKLKPVPSVAKKSTQLPLKPEVNDVRLDFSQPDMVSRKFSELSNNYEQLKRTLEREQQKTEALQRQMLQMEAKFDSYKRQQQEKFNSVLGLLHNNRKDLISEEDDGDGIDDIEEIL